MFQANTNDALTVFWIERLHDLLGRWTQENPLHGQPAPLQLVETSTSS